MNKKAASLVFIFLLISSVTAQDQRTSEANLKRDCPQVELIRPTIPPQYYNFKLHRWERRADSMGIEIETKTQELSDVLTAPKQRRRKGNVQWRKRTSNNDMHRSRRSNVLMHTRSAARRPGDVGR
jgi:hypothetical protein